MVRKKTRPSFSSKSKPTVSKSKKSDKEVATKLVVHPSTQRTVSKNNTTVAKKKIASLQVVVQHHPETMKMTRSLYKEIKGLQLYTNHLLPRLPFQRVVREIMMELSTNNEILRIQTDALRALQESAEMYMTQFFEDSYFCTLHAKRKTLYVADMQCARRLRGRVDTINH